MNKRLANNITLRIKNKKTDKNEVKVTEPETIKNKRRRSKIQYPGTEGTGPSTGLTLEKTHPSDAYMPITEYTTEK